MMGLILSNKNIDPRLDRLYATQLNIKDYIEYKKGGALADHDDYIANPDKYQSNFHHTVSIFNPYPFVKLTNDRIFRSLHTQIV